MATDTALDTAIRMCINWARSSNNQYRVSQADVAAAQLSDLLVENAALRSQVAEAQAERDALVEGLKAYIKDCRESAANSYKTPRNRGWAEALVGVADVLEEILEARTDAAQRTG